MRLRCAGCAVAVAGWTAVGLDAAGLGVVGRCWAVVALGLAITGSTTAALAGAQRSGDEHFAAGRAYERRAVLRELNGRGPRVVSLPRPGRAGRRGPFAES